jgi:hypothetical protein
MPGRVYAYADVGRTGLGNMLFPWARAEVFAHRHGVRMLAPRWVRPRIGPLLRGERDKRLYAGLFDNRCYVRGARRWAALLRGTVIDEADAAAFMERRGRGEAGSRGTAVVRFSGYEWWFEGIGPHQRLVPHRALVCRRLREILSARVRRRLEASPASFAIAAHVRRGDRPPMEFMEPYPGAIDGIPQHHKTMPDRWLINCITGVREALGVEAPVTVFSDAMDEQLRPLLSLPRVERAAANPSIVDIFLLARARVLITTGTSSFSAWAAYIGGMPALWYPGLRLDLIEGRPELAIETDLAGRLPAGAAAVLRQAAGA